MDPLKKFWGSQITSSIKAIKNSSYYHCDNGKHQSRKKVKNIEKRLKAIQSIYYFDIQILNTKLQKQNIQPTGDCKR